MLMGGSAGGFRGFSLSLWTEALALLNGKPFISGSENVPEEEKGPMHELGLQSFTLLVIDPAAFTSVRAMCCPLYCPRARWYRAVTSSAFAEQTGVCCLHLPAIPGRGPTAALPELS